CYYLAKLFLDIVNTEFIQFKATEVLMTLYKKDSITFAVVQLDLDQYAENFLTLDQNKRKFQDMKEYIDKKYTYIHQASGRTSFKMPVSKLQAKRPEELLNSNPDYLLILDIIAEHLTCPFTQEVTD